MTDEFKIINLHDIVDQVVANPPHPGERPNEYNERMRSMSRHPTAQANRRQQAEQFVLMLYRICRKRGMTPMQAMRTAHAAVKGISEAVDVLSSGVTADAAMQTYCANKFIRKIQTLCGHDNVMLAAYWYLGHLDS